MAPPLPNSAHGDQLISAKPRGPRAVFERPSYLMRLRRTDWLGRVDSNLCISESEFAKTLNPGRRDSNLCIWKSTRSSSGRFFLPEDHAGVLPQGAIKFRFGQNFP